MALMTGWLTVKSSPSPVERARPRCFKSRPHTEGASKNMANEGWMATLLELFSVLHARYGTRYGTPSGPKYKTF